MNPALAVYCNPEAAAAAAAAAVAAVVSHCWALDVTWFLGNPGISMDLGVKGLHWAPWDYGEDGIGCS